MKIFSSVVNSISAFFDKIAGWVFIGLMVLVVLNVILRCAFSAPIKGAFEYVGFYTALAIAFSIAFCAFKDGHIAITFIVEKIFSQKTLKVISVFLNIISAAFFVFTAWELFDYGADMVVRGDLSVTTRTPYYPFIYIIALCFVVLAVVLLYRVTGLIGALKEED